MFIAQLLSGTWWGDVTHLRRALGFSLRDLADGQWWRIFTPNLTNGPIPPDFGPPGLTHLLGNVAGLLAVGPVVERSFGRVRYPALVVVTGAVAYGWLVLPATKTVYADGTSGVVYGLLGAFAVLIVAHPPRSRWGRVGVAIVAISALRGVVGRELITQQIHGGGFAAGVVLGIVFRRTRRTISGLAGAAVMTAALLGVVAVRLPQLTKTDARVASSVRVGGFPALLTLDNGHPVVGTAGPAQVVAPGRWRTAVGSNPGAVLVAAGSEWVTSVDHGTVTRLSPAGLVMTRLSVGPKPYGMAFDGHDLWVASIGLRGRLWRIDPKLNRVTGSVDTAAAGYAATFTDGAVWVADGRHRSVVRVDQTTMAVRRIPIGGVSAAIAPGPHGTVLVGLPGAVAVVDTAADRLARRVSVGRHAFVTDIETAPDGRAWVADAHGNRLLALDASGKRIVDRLRLGLIQPVDLAVDATQIWATDYWGGRLLRIDLR